MSTRTPTDDADPIEGCRPADVTPVRLDGDRLESTDQAALDEVREALSRNDFTPTSLSVTAQFPNDCSLSVQREADRIREYVRAAAYLNVDTVTVTCRSVTAPEKVKPALAACVERATRDGLRLEVDGPVAVE